MNVDLGAAYDFNSQSAGFNLSYGGAFNFNMEDTGDCGCGAACGCDGETCGATCGCGCAGAGSCGCTDGSSTNWDIGGGASVEKYLVGGNKGMFAYGDANFSMDGGDQAEGVDDN